MWYDLLISYGFIVVAAFFNACMDAFENENFHESIFKNRKQEFWYKRESWKYAPKIFGYKLDAWHLSKSLMVISFALAILFSFPLHGFIVRLITIGVLWNVAFWLFYHKLFKIK